MLKKSFSPANGDTILFTEQYLGGKGTDKTENSLNLKKSGRNTVAEKMKLVPSWQEQSLFLCFWRVEASIQSFLFRNIQFWIQRKQNIAWQYLWFCKI